MINFNFNPQVNHGHATNVSVGNDNGNIVGGGNGADNGNQGLVQAQGNESNTTQTNAIVLIGNIIV